MCKCESLSSLLTFVGLSEPAAFHYNTDTEECSCYSASEYKIMRVYPSHHSALNDTIPTADFYLVEINVYGKYPKNTFTCTNLYTIIYYILYYI